MKSSKSFLRVYAKKLPPGIIVLLILIAGAILGFTLLVDEVLMEEEIQVDLSVFQFLAAHIISDGMTKFMKVVTYFASAAFLPIAYGIVIIFYLLRKEIQALMTIGQNSEMQLSPKIIQRLNR